jgi:GT2 family glycosyltransferase
LSGIEMICVNYRTPDDLARFCASVLAAPPQIDWHLSVVNVEVSRLDTAMTERIRHKFSEQGLESRFAAMNIHNNVGYARACNGAADRAKEGDHDFLAFFNADVALTPGAVDSCVAAFTDQAGWGVIGPRQVDSKGRLTHAGIFGTLDRPQHRAWRQPNSPQYADVVPAVTVSGSAYFMRRRLWDLLASCPLYRQVAPNAHGAFLPTAHYFEETYCSYHAQAHGWKVMYYGPVVIHHEWHQASPVGGWAERQFPISQKYFREACDVHGIPHD